MKPPSVIRLTNYKMTLYSKIIIHPLICQYGLINRFNGMSFFLNHDRICFKRAFENETLTAHVFRGVGYLMNNIQKCFIDVIKGHQILKNK